MHLRLKALRAFSPRALRLANLRRKIAEAFDSGDYAAAEQMLLRGIAIHFGDTDFLVRYALCATNGGHARDALPRWRHVVSAAPDLPMGWCGIAASYRSLEDFPAALEAVKQALQRHPDDLVVQTEAARCHMACALKEEALALWNQILMSGNVHPDWLFGRAETLFELERYDEAESALLDLRAAAPDHLGVWPLERALREHRDDRPAPVRYAEAPAGSTPILPQDLVLHFESLGDNCEFGLVQRYCFAEPLGLFRFSFANLDKLISLMEQDFAFYGDADDLELFIRDGYDAYECHSRYYDSFDYHTEMYTYEIDPDALLAREAKKVKYLIRRMKDDLSSAEKIFVRKGESFGNAIPLARALRAHGPATLLWVEEADADHPPGSVKVVETGLLHGRVARFAPYGNAHDIDLPTWMTLLCNAVRLTTGEHLAIKTNSQLACGHNWAVAEKAECETVERPFFAGAKTQRLRLLADTERAAAIVAVRFLAPEIEPRTLITISLWILIPDTFEGSVIDICFTNSSNGFVGHADLRRRGVWQRIFASTRQPKDQTRAAVGIRITGRKGDTVYIASWHLETGCIPNRLADPVRQDENQAQLAPHTIAMGTSAGV